MLFFLFMLPYLNTAYELSCPSSSHWTLRAEGLCTNVLSSQYYCLWDTNTKSYTESCSKKPDVARKGRKYIVEGSPTFVPCSLDRYQPITFYRNASSHCILLKSLCTEKGQILSGQGSAEDDVGCRCDYRQGFDYVIRPKDICHCNPTQEDCSCVQKQCETNRYLSADYQCVTKDVFLETFQCGSITELHEENTTTSNGILRDSTLKSTTNWQMCVMVLLVIVIALCIVTGIILRTVAVRNREQEINTGISLEKQIIGNWRKLKQTINHERMLSSLVNAGIILTTLKQDFKTKSPNRQKNHYLICLIRNGSAKRCLPILRKQGKSTMQVLMKQVVNPKWSKRSLEQCRQHLDSCNESFLEFFNPDQDVDNFLESFIFDINDYEEILNCEDSKTMKKCLMEKVKHLLHKGSFECLLKVLKDNGSVILSAELEKDLPPAISCNCEDGKIYSKCKVPKDNYKIDLTLSCLSSANLNEEIKSWNPSCDCLVWFVKTFAMYPVTAFVKGNATFQPLSDTTIEHIKKGSQCGNWLHFIETVFIKDLFKNFEGGGNILIEMKLSVYGVHENGGDKEKLSGQKPCKDASVNIFTANRNFIASHINVNELMTAFSKQRQSVFQDCDDIPDIHKQAERFVDLLGSNIHLKRKFIRILEKQREKNKKILDRLNTFQKVFNSNADQLPGNIMYYFPDLVCLADDFESFRNDFVERNIIFKELDIMQEIRLENNEYKMIAFLICILKSRGRNTMLSLVDSLYKREAKRDTKGTRDNYNLDSLAERLLQRKDHNTIEVSDSNIITESVCKNDHLLFYGKFKVCYVE